MKKLLVSSIVLVLLAGCAKTGPTGPTGPTGAQGPAGPEGSGYSEVSIIASQDGAIGPTLSNVGSATTMGFGYSTSVTNYYRVLMYFDIAQANLPANATVTSAILTLYPAGGTTAVNVVDAKLHAVTKNWSESDATHIKATGTTNWTSAGGDFVSTSDIGSFSVDVATTNKIEVEIDATTIRSWINGQFNYGFIIKSATESGADATMAIYSKDYSTDPSKRPSLKLIYK